MPKARRAKSESMSASGKSRPAGKKGAHLSLLNRLAQMLLAHQWIVMFIALWAFLYFFYGDTMRIAPRRSFFAFSEQAMEYWLCQPLGWLYVVGRLLLTINRWPICGTLLVSAMLTLAARLLDYALQLKGWGKAVAFAAPFIYVGYVLYKGLNLFYQAEPSWIMNWPLLALLLCALLATPRRLLGKRTSLPSVTKRPLTKGVLTVFAALWVGSVAVAMTYGQNDRLTCSMECKMLDEDWDAMAELAKAASRPSRTVAGYHALALNQNGQLASELFNIPYQYRNAHLTRKDGSFDGGLDYIVVDCNFHAGLTRSAYHEAMEQNVLEGPSVQRLERMVQCAMIDGERALAEKYLTILKKVPFEGGFVEKYWPMLSDSNMVKRDPLFASVVELQPVHDSFEQNYREPIFLGYNLALQEAKTLRGLHNSLYACLYTKDMKAFGSRILTLIDNGVRLPKIYEEAIVVQNIKNLAALKQLNLSPYILQQMREFMGECFTKQDLDKSIDKAEMQKEKGRKYKKYLGTYEYYYYFQNIPDENYVVPGQQEKGGVN